MNWDGTVSGIKNGDQRKFHSLAEEAAVQRQMSGLTDESIGSSTRSNSRDTSDRGHGDEDEQQQQQQQQQENGDDGDRPRTPSHNAFARVDAIASESPADIAGLKEDDLIVEFGPINESNHQHLRAIADLVPDVAGERKSIQLVVRRKLGNDDEWETKTLSLSPRPWPGRGLLGCHIVPYSE